MFKRDILAEVGETISTFILGSVGTAAFLLMLVYFA